MTEYSPARIILGLAFDGSHSTGEVEDKLGCSRETARQKLLLLESCGVVTQKTVGDTFVWSLSEDALSERSNAIQSQDTIELLITETLQELADHLAQPGQALPENIIEWIEDRDVDDTLSEAVFAYRMGLFKRLLRATLYSLHEDEHESLDPLVADIHWNSQLDYAYKETGDSGLARAPIERLIDSDVEIVSKLLIALTNALGNVENPATTLTTVYESLVPQDTRRSLGQFGTPDYVSDFLASWAVREADDSILDPGIGAGQLASSGLDRKLKLGAERPLSEITGVDVDDVAISMASVTLKLVDGSGKPNLYLNDFMEYSPHSWDEDSYEQKTVDGVIANPPYSRHQALDEEFKNTLSETVSRETGREFSPRTPLYGYFIAHAAQFLESGGRFAAIVPSQFFDTEFGRDLKEYLLSEFTIHGIVQLADELDVFEDVRTRPSILLLEKGAPDHSHEINFCRLTSWDGISDAPELLQSDFESFPAVESNTTVVQDLVPAHQRWSVYLDETEILDRSELTEFETIASIKRGIATGSNDFFCLTGEEVADLGIPEKYRRRIIKSARGMDYVNLTESNWETWETEGKSVWLLYCREDGAPVERNELPRTVDEYLAQGESSGVTDGYLVSKRSYWYQVEARDPAPILGKYMNRTGFLFMRNDADLLTLNNVHAIDLNFGYTDDERDALLAYLNSTVMEQILSAASHDYSGLQKIEIGQLSGAAVIDPRELTPSKRETLANSFDELCEKRQNGRSGEEVIEEIDKSIESILDLRARDSNELQSN
ncbi:N-6 DNA methylase [Halobaculum marinum]|uniref:N-6 DNA methylase n=1 Tax=Halobaculum marinum TaxID=3031996 RepID=A0ABD5WR89_9EURY|nr:N-6 DNA methylase [Halobaculum sp. DT55]